MNARAMQQWRRCAAMAALSAAALMAAIGCSEQRPYEAAGRRGEKLSGVVRISGSSTMAPLITEMVKDFQKLHAGIDIEVQAGGSGRGLSDARTGKSDIGMVSKVLPADERELVPFLIARDGIGISVHSENPVKSLSPKQVSDIYTKAVGNWRELGLRDAPIYVIAASPEAGSTELFQTYFGLKPAEVRADVLAQPNSDRFAALAGNTSAILYSSLGEAERRAAAGEKVKMLAVEGIAASSDNLAAGRYPLARPLALVTKGLPSGPTKAFIDYARSPAASALIDRYEFVPYRD